MSAGSVSIKLAKKRQPPFDAPRRDRLLDLLRGGIAEWNAWRCHNPDEFIDLRDADLFEIFGLKGDDYPPQRYGPLMGVDLHEANLEGSNLSKIDLRGANLSAVWAPKVQLDGAWLMGADLSGSIFSDCHAIVADFSGADLRLTRLSSSFLMSCKFDNANLRRASLSMSQVLDCSFERAILVEAELDDAILKESYFSGANLSGASLVGAGLVTTKLNNANLDGCRVFGASAWKCDLNGTRQTNLIITPKNEPEITLDNISVAQFVYLILNNQAVREVIDTITSKVVLILGRFTPERKRVLDALRDELRKHDYTPILFDFSRPAAKSFIGTIKTLAGMTRFVVADLSDARVVVQEIDLLLREFPTLPLQPILVRSQQPPEILLDYFDHGNFLSIHRYETTHDLIAALEPSVIAPVEKWIRDMGRRREMAVRDLSGE